MKRYADLIFWGITSLVLLLFFGITTGNIAYAFYFLVFFVPVTITTSSVINHILIPRYLLKKRYGRFALYLAYTVIISLDLELVAVYIAFILIGLYDAENLPSIVADYRLIPVIMYFIVMLYGFIRVIREYMDLQQLETGKNTMNKHILVRANRQNRNIRVDSICYIESMADYIKIILENGETVITREKISSIEKQLPSPFVRIHRAYIVNRQHLVSFTREFVTIAGKELPISRTYKAEALTSLGHRTTTSQQ